RQYTDIGAQGVELGLPTTENVVACERLERSKQTKIVEAFADVVQGRVRNGNAVEPDQRLQRVLEFGQCLLLDRCRVAHQIALELGLDGTGALLRIGLERGRHRVGANQFRQRLPPHVGRQRHLSVQSLRLDGDKVISQQLGRGGL